MCVIHRTKIYPLDGYVNIDSGLDINPEWWLPVMLVVS